MDERLWIIQLVVSSGLLTLIWLVQLLQYPSFLLYDKTSFKAAMKHHQDRISLIVLPLMLTELMVSVILFYMKMNFLEGAILLIVLTIWVLTFLVQVPLHQKLFIHGFDQNHIKRLVTSNWTRVGLWSVKWMLVMTIYF